LNSDSEIYGGGNKGNFGGVTAENHPCHNQSYSAEFYLPPLSVSVFQAE
jgi:1,4-alpha-glucan branching enzyme